MFLGTRTCQVEIENSRRTAVRYGCWSGESLLIHKRGTLDNQTTSSTVISIVGPITPGFFAVTCHPQSVYQVSAVGLRMLGRRWYECPLGTSQRQGRPPFRPLDQQACRNTPLVVKTRSAGQSRGSSSTSESLRGTGTPRSSGDSNISAGPRMYISAGRPPSSPGSL